MTHSAKRKISAKAIRSDIRAGCNPADLKLKYNLSDQELMAVCNKLCAAGALHQEDIKKLHTQLLNDVSQDKELNPYWSCPACATEYESPMKECLHCGIIVEKYAASRNLHPDLGIIQDVAMSRQKTGSWWTVLVSIAAVVVFGLAVILWSNHQSVKKIQQNTAVQSNNAIATPEGNPETSIPDEEQTTSIDQTTENSDSNPESTRIETDDTGHFSHSAVLEHKTSGAYSH